MGAKKFFEVTPCITHLFGYNHASAFLSEKKLERATLISLCSDIESRINQRNEVLSSLEDTQRIVTQSRDYLVQENSVLLKRIQNIASLPGLNHQSAFWVVVLFIIFSRCVLRLCAVYNKTLFLFIVYGMIGREAFTKIRIPSFLIPSNFNRQELDFWHWNKSTCIRIFNVGFDAVRTHRE